MISSKPLINSKASRRFKRLALNTVITLYLLIIAGGVVRSTGAGMGCPDWPKCFGRWVPPTELSELPVNYKEIYGTKLKGEIEFNAVKTWTEYVNRLLGAFTGLMIFLTLLASWAYLKSQKRIFYYALAAFLLVGFQGWLGAKVVSFELHPVIVTLHMLLAIVIVFILIYVYVLSKYTYSEGSEKPQKGVAGVGIFVLSITLVQVLIGTQVRENMDEVIRILGYQARTEWIEQLGARFYVHRSFSLLVLGANLYWFYLIRGAGNSRDSVEKYIKGCLVVLGAEILTGIIMAYLGVPPFAQPLHLTFGILLLGLQFIIYLLVNPNRYLSLQSGVRD
ncbi:Heme A synthase [Dyadobacter sp. CECT 9275]|uniref:Heme A synthase n=1 Tax=Dyadobacter helix TaxID=2822344 RepID=A0A916NDJ8_9BACT|nr:COX15/CtaA family protein [Dyadobacter sp. CECT 9275]CAG5008641.1 Heme A synthase [Dyadobacter sp. CECT 9275]